MAVDVRQQAEVFPQCGALMLTDAIRQVSGREIEAIGRLQGDLPLLEDARMAIAAEQGGFRGRVTLLPGCLDDQSGKDGHSKCSMDLAAEPSVKRSMRSCSIGMLVRPIATNSDMTEPAPGPNWKPCDEKPN